MPPAHAAPCQAGHSSEGMPCGTLHEYDASMNNDHLINKAALQLHKVFAVMVRIQKACGHLEGQWKHISKSGGH